MNDDCNGYGIKILQMVINMKAISFKINFGVKVSFTFLLVKAIKVNLKMIIFMVKENILKEKI
jgi:hypothetical protein